MNALKKSVADGKSAIASAITAQGVSTAADASYATMANNVKTACNNKYNAGVTAGTTKATFAQTTVNIGHTAGTQANTVFTFAVLAGKSLKYVFPASGFWAGGDSNGGGGNIYIEITGWNTARLRYSNSSGYIGGTLIGLYN